MSWEVVFVNKGAKKEVGKDLLNFSEKAYGEYLALEEIIEKNGTQAIELENLIKYIREDVCELHIKGGNNPAVVLYWIPRQGIFEILSCFVEKDGKTVDKYIGTALKRKKGVNIMGTDKSLKKRALKNPEVKKAYDQTIKKFAPILRELEKEAKSKTAVVDKKLDKLEVAHIFG